MKIAIIGSGIAGNTIAHLLHKNHDITLYEKENRVGGHAHTHEIKINNENISVDTGFIVFNKATYPLFTELMDSKNVKYENSDMSFSVFSKINNLEYNGTSINSLFSQRKNFFNFKFLKMIYEIFKFNKNAPDILKINNEISLGTYLEKERYSNYFKNYYILPMGSAIWSSKFSKMLDFPAKLFIQFFNNHGMLSINQRPQWLTIKDGSQKYVEKLIYPFKDKIKLNSNIQTIKRFDNFVSIKCNNKEEKYDYLFLACHSDEALSLLSNASIMEKDILNAIPYEQNNVILHTDDRLLPKKKLTWAAWNYNIDNDTKAPVRLTYNMNILQNLNTNLTILVSLNSEDQIQKDKIIKKINYRHPSFSLMSVQAQKRKNQISGKRRTFYAGAYWGNGFHEDGVKSAYEAVENFNNLLT